MLRLVVIATGVLAFGFMVWPFLLKRWSHRVASFSVGILLLVGAGFLAHHAYHIATDQQRVEDLHRIAAIVDEFHNRTGRYPLALLEIPVTVGVNMTNADLPDRYLRPPPGAPGAIVPYAVLLNELRSVLGDDLELPQDPQNVAVYAPTFYQYQYFEGGHYFVSGNLYFERSGTERLGRHYFKYELSSFGRRPDR